ncbi:MAG: peptidylprolyl isomerase [Chitinophagaceae bacterium]|jgi:peptidyl-prolyl cis-trans isomerase D
MSIIQQIRDKAAVLLTSLIALSLIGFLVQDAFIGRSSGLFSDQPSSVGSVNGKEIDVMEFNNKVNAAEQSYRSQGMESNEMMTQNIVESIWNGYVMEELIQSAASKAGLSLTSKELGALLFSESAPQEFRQLFTDPNTGMFDLQAAKTWFTNLKKNKRADEIKMVTDQLLNPLSMRLLNDKYNSLFVQGAYAPKWMLEKQNNDNSLISSIAYVGLPYAMISDSLKELKVTDAEIDAYVKDHKDDFKQEKVRSVSYVVFDANPNVEDSTNVRSQLDLLREEFFTTADAKAFVTRNNTANTFFDGYVLKSRLQMSAKDDIIAMPVGSVIGPYIDGNTYTMAKKLDVRSLPDTIKCRHILIGIADPRTGQLRRDDSTARRKADSIFSAIKSGADFGMMATQFSEDEGSKMNNGEYTFSSVDITNLAKEFGDFILYKPTGAREIVKTAFGYHIIEVMSQKNFQESFKMAYLAKKILASPETDNAASSAATQFAGTSRDVKAFDENVTKMKLTKLGADNLKEMDYAIAGMPSRQMVKWVFENKVGSVSEPFDLRDRYVVLAVTGSLSEGVQPASLARVMVEPILRNRKKAAEIKKKMGNANSLDNIASSFGTQVMTADSIQFATPYVPEIGNEPKVIGAAFSKSLVNKVSAPIEGSNALFVLQVRQIGATSSMNADINAQKKAVEAQLRQYANFSTMEALRKSAKIEDNRSKVY